MKKMGRRMMSVLLVLVMCVGMAPAFELSAKAYTTETAVSVGSWTDLVTEAAKPNASIKLTADVSGKTTITVASGVTIDGDGHTATFSASVTPGFEITSAVATPATIKDLTIDAANLSGSNNAMRLHYNSGAYKLIMNGVTIKNSKAAGYASGLYINSNSTVEMTDCRFIDNKTSPALYNSGKLTATNCTFTGNSGTSTTYKGGAVSSNGTAVLTRCVFYQNSANQGGAICASGGKLVLDRCSLAENSASNHGGALKVDNTGTAVYANNTVFLNNKGQYGAYHSDGTVYLMNCTSVGNKNKDGYGVGMYNNQGHTYAVNCIFMNSATANGSTNNTGGEFNCEHVTLTNCLSLATYTGCTVTTQAAALEDAATMTLNGVSCSYYPVKSGGLAATNGVETYFDYDDGTVRMSYGAGGATRLNGTSGPGVSTVKVTTYFEDGTRTANAIGASGLPGKTVTYNANGGTASKASDFVENGALNTSITLAKASRDGYTFEGWYKEDGTTKVGNANGTYAVTESITLYAKWTSLPRYNITINSGRGGAVAASPTDPWKGAAVTLTVTPEFGSSLSSLTVDGSNVTSSVSGNRYTFSMPARDVTVTAAFAEATESTDTLKLVRTFEDTDDKPGLKSALSGTGVYAAVTGVIITDDITVTEALAIPDGVTVAGRAKADGKYPTLTLGAGITHSTGTSSLQNLNIASAVSTTTTKIDNQGGTLNMTGVAVKNATGGGLLNNNTAKAVLVDCWFDNNSTSAAKSGGAVTNYGTMVLDRCSFTNNSSSGTGNLRGGAVYTEGKSGGAGRLYANNCVFAKNSASGSGSYIASAIGSYAGHTYLLNCTVMGNTGANALYTTSDYSIDYTYVANSIFASNSGGNVKKYSSGTLQMNYCLYDAGSTDGTKAGCYTTTIANITGSDTLTLTDGKYIPVLSNGDAATKAAVRTYFNYSDLSNVKMGYVTTDDSKTTFSALGDLTALTDEEKAYAPYVTRYFESADRGTDKVIGASKAVTYYTVTFNSNGGSSVEGKSVVEGGKAEVPTAPTKAGYTFAGWYKEAALTNEWNFSNDTVTDNITLYAQWTAAPATAPTINTQPSNLNLSYGYTTDNTLTVAANAAAGHTLSYQWYSNTTNSTEDGTEISGATSASYAVPTDLGVGAYCYYCVVTARRNDNDQTASATSSVATVTVGKAPISPTVTMSGYTYGGTVSSPSVSGNTGDGAVTYYYNTTDSNTSGTEWSDVTATSLNAGTYYLYAEVAESGNYRAGTTAAVGFTIAKGTDPAVVTGTATVTKGGNTVDLSANVTGGVGSVSYAINGETRGCSISGNTFISGNETGSVTVIVTIAGSTNYNAKTAMIAVTVGDKATGSLTVTQSGTTYGGGVFATPDYKKPVDGGTETLSYSGTLRGRGSYGPVATAPTEAGDYTVTVTYETSDTVYTGSASFTISPANIGEAAVTLGDALTYNGVEQTQSVSAVTFGGTNILDSCTVSGNTQTNAGSYTLTVTAKDDSNYTGSVTEGFTIGQKGIIPTIAVTGSYSFTGSEVTPTYTVKDGETLLANTDYTAVLSDNINVGSARITVTKKTDGNYTFDQTEETFTIGKAAAQTLSDVTRNLTYTTTTISESVAGKMPVNAGILTYAAGTAEKTGSVSISTFVVDSTTGAVSATISGGATDDTVTLPVTIRSTNYEDSTVNVIVTLVSKSDANVAISEGSTLTKTYGDSSFTLHATAIEGTNGAWTWSSSNTSVAEVTDAGVVTIKAASSSPITITATYSSDTTIGSATLGLTVNRRAITITADNKTKTMGEEGPTLTYSVSPALVGEDALNSVTLTRAAGETVGTYTITPSDATFSSGSADNYDISYQTGTLTITEAPPTTIPVTGVTLSRSALSLTRGSSATLTATVVPDDATNKAVTWSSSNTSVATVSSGGTVTVVAAGTAAITVTTADGGYTATCAVTVSAPYIPPTPSYDYSDSSDDYTPPTTTTTSANGTSVSVSVSSGVSGGVATVTTASAAALERSVTAGDISGAVELDMSGVSGTVTAITVPASTVKAIEQAVSDPANAADTLAVTLSAGSVTFDADALDAIADQTRGSSLRLDLEAIAISRLNGDQRSAMQDLALESAYSVRLSSGSATISDFRGGTAEVEVRYTLRADQDARWLSVWHVATDGARTRIPSTYENGRVRFTAGHFSNYVIAYDEAMARNSVYRCEKDYTCPISTYWFDSSPTAWYHDGVHWALESGVMGGYSAHSFAPNDGTTRAMVVTMLWRLDGSPQNEYENPFYDVSDSDWSAQAILWARNNGIASGNSPHYFGPDDAITREQLAIMLYNYARYKGIDVSVGEDTNILSYGDAFDLHEYAFPAVQWAVGAGIMTGMTNGTREVVLAPHSGASRAIVATMLMRYCMDIAE